MELYLIYSVLCLVSSGLLVSIGLLSFVHFRSTPSSRPFGILAVCSAFYTFGYAFEIMRGDPGWAFFWLQVQYTGISFIAACWLWLSMEFTGRTRYLRRLLPVMLGLSLFFILAVYTNDLHHLYYTSIETDGSGPFPTARLGKGVLYLAHAFWMLLSLAGSMVIYAVHYLRTPPLFKKQSLIMLIGASWVLFGYMFYQSGGVPWNLDINPLIITLDGFIFAYGVFRTGLLDISPIARGEVFESMKEGVIVTDLSGVMADFNPAAREFLPGLSRDLIGKELLSVVPELANPLSGGPLVLGNSEGLQYYEIRQVPVMVGPGKIAGTAWYMRQITEQHKLFEKLKSYAERDELTGIWNRRIWLEMAKNEIERAERYRCPFSVMIIDVDHFKVVNDQMGHETGDRVLVSIVNTISDGLRKSDIFGRLGGEEFGVILPETAQGAAAAVAERLLQAVSDKKIDFRGSRHTVTISAGVAVCENGSIVSIEELLRRADKALYQAKDSGRNRVCFTRI